jgi:hypothetical protein
MLLLPVLPQACFYRCSGTVRRLGCRDYWTAASISQSCELTRFAYSQLIANSGVGREDGGLTVTIGSRAPGVRTLIWAHRFFWIIGCGTEDKHRVAVTKLGLYERILDDAAQVDIADLDPEQFHVSRRPLDAGDSHSYLVQHLARQIDFVLRSLPVEGRLEAAVALSNKIIDLLEAGTPPASKGTRAGITRANLLLARARKESERPDTPLGTNCLITGTRQDPSLVSQLRKEFATADSVDILCSFIKWSGLRIIEDSLRILAANGKPIR